MEMAEFLDHGEPGNAGYVRALVIIVPGDIVLSGFLLASGISAQ